MLDGCDFRLRFRPCRRLWFQPRRCFRSDECCDTSLSPASRDLEEKRTCILEHMFPHQELSETIHTISIGPDTFWGKSDASCSVSLTPIKGSNRDTTHEHHYLLHGVWMFPLHYKWLITQEVPQLHPPTHWDGCKTGRGDTQSTPPSLHLEVRIWFWLHGHTICLLLHAKH